MQISDVSARLPGHAMHRLAGSAAAAAATLNDPAGDPKAQLDAYQALAHQWRGAAPGEKAGLALALTESAFGQKVHATLNAFTRAAWPGRDAQPPAPQAQALKAFESLSDTDRQIVAALQTDPATGAAFASADAYRAHLTADLEVAQGPARRPDTVSLSSAAQARLAAPAAAADLSAARPAAPAADPTIAAAIAAYSREAG